MQILWNVTGVTNGSILVVLELKFLQLKLNNGAVLHCYFYDLATNYTFAYYF